MNFAVVHQETKGKDNRVKAFNFYLVCPLHLQGAFLFVLFSFSFIYTIAKDIIRK